MRKSIVLLAFVLFLTGCARVPAPPAQPSRTAPQTVAQPAPKAVTKQPPIKTAAKEHPLDGVEGLSQDYVPDKSILSGIVFGKTHFQGVLETSYVRLSIEDQSDPSKKYELYIGDKARQQSLPWNIETVKPGYFFIALPAGQYKIYSVSIPVGSTLATEPINIIFQVMADTVSYLGTLDAIGTQEKVKFGGVPFLRPGFEYTADIFDESREAVAEFKERYPQVKSAVKIDLMKIPAVIDRWKNSDLEHMVEKITNHESAQ